MTRGARINRSGTYAEVPKTCMSRLATAGLSRSVARYQLSVASASLSRR
ncbi:Uncharacterised protein [Mycobacterium tuberculosis]|uniref:Uncharacterized protein n=1 Tax=Mycobacterium tuberculosis TaxID=1773 RepID=A0A0T9EN40_MYCTX|nr:Uncharacterised protein [Mycobacterium tuberculosis]CKR90937.1 Uncharacterised protein [Mycobacterium tuberculosis]CKT26967.1 Uncharacterised protein [Mycobacterium tuberculosis]CNL90720.1 Uncharacterised protein [Mycobacterium tuberculosis]CNM43940.1 Uncharacterised protein [Mycobacterium tuberculosis]